MFETTRSRNSHSRSMCNCRTSVEPLKTQGPIIRHSRLIIFILEFRIFGAQWVENKTRLRILCSESWLRIRGWEKLQTNVSVRCKNINQIWIEEMIYRIVVKRCRDTGVWESLADRPASSLWARLRFTTVTVIDPETRALCPIIRRNSRNIVYTRIYSYIRS